MDIHDVRLRPASVRPRRVAPDGGALRSDLSKAGVSKREGEAANARPPLALVLGPAGAGKTEWALRRFETCTQAGKRALLIVSSPQQARTRAAQLAERLHCALDEVMPCLLTFRQLASSLAAEEDAEDGTAGARSIGRAFQRLALADLFHSGLIRPDDFLGRMLRAPGFVPALTERLREWKLACLTPDTLEQSGPALAVLLADPTFPRKTRELAHLFRAYERFLADHRLRDEEDVLRVAVERVQSGMAHLPQQAACVVVDGFYRFNPMQRRLLAAVARHATDADAMPVEVALTLPYETRRPLLFAAPARTLTLLRQEFACQETTLTHHSPDRPKPLAQLSDQLFGVQGLGVGDAVFGEETSVEERAADANCSPTPGVHQLGGRLNTEHRTPNTEHLNTELPPLQLFDAPNPYVEAEMVAREFRRLYDAGGFAWSDFAVILRAMGDYAPILAAVFERHGIPLGVDGPEILAENPFVKTLLHLLGVIRNGWKRDDVLAFLKSSYTAPDQLEADSLRRQARHAGVREGREQWLKLAEGEGVGCWVLGVGCWVLGVGENAAPTLNAQRSTPNTLRLCHAA